MKSLLLSLIIIGCAAHTFGAETAKTFSVAGLTFSQPSGWTAESPQSSMRKAQFKVAGEDGAAEVVFFHFGPGQGGGVQANIDRWLGQFSEPKEQLNATTEKKTVNDIEITLVTAEGTFLSGPPMGQTTAMKDHALLGAIVKNEAGDVFIKMTGPKSTVTAAKESFMGMIDSVKP